MKAKHTSLALILAAAMSGGFNKVHADEYLHQYMSAEDFIKQSFQGEKADWKMLTLTPELKQKAKQILGHDYLGSRIRYWRIADRTVWVLEEIGKEKPITIGLAINQDRVEAVKVLVYRESRGGEVADQSFVQQFDQAQLNADSTLTKKVDNIAGATLSVNAMTKVTRLALVFHKQVVHPF